MKIYLDLPDDAGGFTQINWLSTWRIPVTGDLLLLPNGVFRVDLVQFELEDEPAVQVRVIPQ